MRNIPVLTILAIILLPLDLLSQENTAQTCSDGIDNDGDGLIDCLDSECSNLPNEGCPICTDGISFADLLIEYTPGCPRSDPNPDGALGVSDWTGGTEDEPQFVFLGQGGILKLGFTNNILTNSGDSQVDLWVFEVGPAVESSDLALKPLDAFTESQLLLRGIPDSNSDGYYEIGNISGSTSGLDIDIIIPGYTTGELKFDAIEIKDVIDAVCNEGTPGADIDAVCALFSIATDCAGTPNGASIIDNCGECLDPADPAFNQSCADCAGTPNGAAVIDDCGQCLDPIDPSFNQTCVDCSGVLNGAAIIDDCGQCLVPTDPNFNQTCTDCAGTPNGTAIIDDCGQCLVPTNPSFNQSCVDCSGTPNGTAVINSCGLCLQPTDPNFHQSCRKEVYIPNVFSPNDDGKNDKLQVYTNSGNDAEVYIYRVFSRWGELLYEANNFSIYDATNWWNGEFNGKKVDAGVYVLYVEILFLDNTIRKFKKGVTVIR